MSMHSTSNPSASGWQWYVVHCKPREERRAAAALEEQLGLKVYLPEVTRRVRGRIQRAPFFPRYLFVWANLLQVKVTGIHAINTMPGVLRLVEFGNIARPVLAAVIEAIRKRIDALNAQGGLPEHRFHPGETLRLTDGPLQGLEAVFVRPMKSSERVRVLINFLGSLRDAEVNADMLEKVRTPRRERRTRGKGRRIKHPPTIPSVP